MKKLLTIIFILCAAQSFGQGNWPVSGTKNRWANGMGLSSKSDAQLAAFTNASDSLLLQWYRVDSTIAIRYSVNGPWRYLVTSGSLSGYLPISGGTLTSPGQLNATGIGVTGGISSTLLTITGARASGIHIPGVTLNNTTSSAVSYSPGIDLFGTTTTTKGVRLLGQSTATGGHFNVKTTADGTTFSDLLLTTVAGFRIFNSSGFYGDFLKTSLTANRSFTLPDNSGTLALTGDLSGYLPISGGTLTAPGQLNATGIGVTGGISSTILSVTGVANFGTVSTTRITMAENGAGSTPSYIDFPSLLTGAVLSTPNANHIRIAGAAPHQLQMKGENGNKQSLDWSGITTGRTLFTPDLTGEIVVNSGNQNIITTGNIQAANITATQTVTAASLSTNTIYLSGNSGTNAVIINNNGNTITSMDNAGNIVASGTVKMSTLSVTGQGYVGSDFGIGETSPLGKLHVKTVGATDWYNSNTSSITSGNRWSLGVLNNSISTVASMRAVAVTDNVGTKMEWYTRPVAGSLTLGMTLSENQNLNVAGAVTGNSIVKSGGTSSEYLMADGSVTTLTGTIASGTFTPTCSNVSGTGTFTPYQGQYMRVGNTVTFSGMIDLITTTTGQVSFEITLPVASTFTQESNASGTLVTKQFNAFGFVRGVGSAARLTFSETAAGVRSVVYTFTYLVL